MLAPTSSTLTVAVGGLVDARSGVESRRLMMMPLGESDDVDAKSSLSCTPSSPTPSLPLPLPFGAAGIIGDGSPSLRRRVYVVGRWSVQLWPSERQARCTAPRMLKDSKQAKERCDKPKPNVKVSAVAR